MGRIKDFFQNFKSRYDASLIRNQRMDEFLASAKDNYNKIDGMSHTIHELSDSLEHIQKNIDTLSQSVVHINGRLEILGEGTKMELFDTLYHWKKILVDDRGWATAAEKKEVNDIYRIYHTELKGNGQGEVYFNQIMNLPERDPTNS